MFYDINHVKFDIANHLKYIFHYYNISIIDHYVLWTAVLESVQMLGAYIIVWWVMIDMRAEDRGGVGCGFSCVLLMTVVGHSENVKWHR